MFKFVVIPLFALCMNIIVDMLGRYIKNKKPYWRVSLIRVFLPGGGTKKILPTFFSSLSILIFILILEIILYKAGQAGLILIMAALIIAPTLATIVYPAERFIAHLTLKK